MQSKLDSKGIAAQKAPQHAYNIKGNSVNSSKYIEFNHFVSQCSTTWTMIMIFTCGEHVQILSTKLSVKQSESKEQTVKSRK